MNPDSKVFIAGHNGLVGSAIKRNLENKNYNKIFWVRRKNCDLRNRSHVEEYFTHAKPEYVFLAAAKVGGIHANKTYPAEFIYDNLMIQCNVIDAAYRHGVKKLVVLGSSCIYPKNPKIPITEDQLLTSELEPTNDAYAIAKIAGLRMARAYREQYGFNAISLMPTNLYGPGDNYHPENSHVMPGLIRRFHEARENGDPVVTCWGDGSPMREFLYVDDLAEACYMCMQKYDEDGHINVGTGKDVSIKKLAETIASVVEYEGKIEWDTSKPNGTPRKVMDVNKIKIKVGWHPGTSLRDGIESSYCDYLENVVNESIPLWKNGLDSYNTLYNSPGPFLAYFSSPTCCICPRTKRQLQRLVKETGIPLVDINGDKEKDLYNHYQLGGFPNVLLFKEKKLVKTWSGYKGRSEYKSVIEKL